MVKMRTSRHIRLSFSANCLVLKIPTALQIVNPPISIAAILVYAVNKNAKPIHGNSPA